MSQLMRQSLILARLACLKKSPEESFVDEREQVSMQKGFDECKGCIYLIKLMGPLKTSSSASSSPNFRIHSELIVIF